jgi:hypothetical protein
MAARKSEGTAPRDVAERTGPGEWANGQHLRRQPREWGRDDFMLTVDARQTRLA